MAGALNADQSAKGDINEKKKGDEGAYRQIKSNGSGEWARGMQGAGGMVSNGGLRGILKAEAVKLLRTKAHQRERGPLKGKKQRRAWRGCGGTVVATPALSRARPQHLLGVKNSAPIDERKQILAEWRVVEVTCTLRHNPDGPFRGEVSMGGAPDCWPRAAMRSRARGSAVPP